MEKPFVPFYKPYGMTDEEYSYAVRIAEQELAVWQQMQDDMEEEERREIAEVEQKIKDLPETLAGRIQKEILYCTRQEYEGLAEHIIEKIGNCNNCKHSYTSPDYLTGEQQLKCNFYLRDTKKFAFCSEFEGKK